MTHSLFQYHTLTKLEHEPQPSTWIGTYWELAFRWIGLLALVFCAGRILVVSDPLYFILAYIVLFSAGVLWSLGAKKCDRRLFVSHYLQSDAIALGFWTCLLALRLWGDSAQYPKVIQLISTVVILFVITYFWLVVFKRITGSKQFWAYVISVWVIVTAFYAHQKTAIGEYLVPRECRLLSNKFPYSLGRPHPGPDHFPQQK